jgi:hypothetical protein
MYGRQTPAILCIGAIFVVQYRVPLLLHACICMQESVITNDDSLISDIPTNKQAKQHAKQKAKHTNTSQTQHTYIQYYYYNYYSPPVCKENNHKRNETKRKRGEAKIKAPYPYHTHTIPYYTILYSTLNSTGKSHLHPILSYPHHHFLQVLQTNKQNKESLSTKK